MEGNVPTSFNEIQIVEVVSNGRNFFLLALNSFENFFHCDGSGREMRCITNACLNFVKNCVRKVSPCLHLVPSEFLFLFVSIDDPNGVAT